MDVVYSIEYTSKVKKYVGATSSEVAFFMLTCIKRIELTGKMKVLLSKNEVHQRKGSFFAR
ncbi:hypothetical protein [Paenibacillus sp. DS2015]|uniref:hypothetical protein n=1 Tax=Paenibacillus sp. DS2015 TaxID=3373917 RepID=UPI003D19C3F0